MGQQVTRTESVATSSKRPNNWIPRKSSSKAKPTLSETVNENENRLQPILSINGDDEIDPNNVPEKDALKYSQSGVFYAAFGRSPALLITFFIELIPAFVVASGSGELHHYLTSKQSDILIGFLTIISAISGNVGLQSSSLMTRALSHAYANKTNIKSVFCKEILASIIMGALMAIIIGITGYFWAHSIRVAIVVATAQFLAVFVASATGTASPIFFHWILGRDPGMWAGPLETAVQDIIGSTSLFFGGIALLTVMPDSWS